MTVRQVMSTGRRPRLIMSTIHQQANTMYMEAFMIPTPMPMAEKDFDITHKRDTTQSPLTMATTTIIPWEFPTAMK